MCNQPDLALSGSDQPLPGAVSPRLWREQQAANGSPGFIRPGTSLPAQGGLMGSMSISAQQTVNWRPMISLP